MAGGGVGSSSQHIEAGQSLSCSTYKVVTYFRGFPDV